MAVYDGGHAMSHRSVRNSYGLGGCSSVTIMTWQMADAAHHHTHTHTHTHTHQGREHVCSGADQALPHRTGGVPPRRERWEPW